MAWLRIVWNDINRSKVAANGLTPEDVDFVIDNSFSEGVSRTSGRLVCFGWVPDGRFIIVPYEVLDEDMIYPVTAYEVSEPVE